MRRIALLIALLSTVQLVTTSCIREEIEDRPQRPKPLEFESFGLQSPLRPIGNPRGVNLIAELSSRDIRAHHEKLRKHWDDEVRRKLDEGEYQATMFIEDDIEVWRAGPHQVAYQHGRFLVDGLTYTRAPYAKLFLFKERTGDFRFRFHEQVVTVEVDGKWKPSVYYSIQNVTADGTPMSEVRKRERSQRVGASSLPTVHRTYAIERVEIGQRVIQVDARTRSWKVDGKLYRPSAQKTLILEGVRPFASE